MSSKTKKISKNAKAQENQVQLDLLTQYFSEYSLMNHYMKWVNSKLAKEKTPKGLNYKIFFNPLLKLFRKK